MLGTEFIRDAKGNALCAYGEIRSPHVFLQPVDGHDAALMESQTEKLKALCGHTDWCILTIPITDWNGELTPWESGPVFGKDGFGSGAAATLSFIGSSVIPAFYYDHLSDTIHRPARPLRSRFLGCTVSLRVSPC